MARIRTIKPEFFRHEGLFEAERTSGLPLRVAFAGLWTVADREGRFRWRPRQLKLDVLPFDEADFAKVLDTLEAAGFVGRYAEAGEEYGYIPTWHKHQVVNNRETPSALPAPTGPGTREARVSDASATREPRDGDVTGTPLVHAQAEGEGEREEISEEADASSSSSATTKSSSNRPTIPCPYTAIVERYHEALPTLPKVRLMPAKRQAAMRKVWGWVLSSRKADGTRRATNAGEALRWFADYFARAAANDWLMGKTPRSAEHAGWQCDIDFLLTDRGMKAVIEKTEAAA